MPIDVVTSIEIGRSREETAGYASDPDHVREWYQNISAVEWVTSPPVRVGSRIAFVASFLGRRLAYTYEVTELVPGRRLVMRTSHGAFPMQTTYRWEDTPGGTLMTLRNTGEPTGFARVGGPALAAAMRRANRKDLDRLKHLLEA